MSRSINIRVNIRLRLEDRQRLFDCFENRRDAIETLALRLTELADGEIPFSYLCRFDNKTITRQEHSLVQPSVPMEIVKKLHDLCDRNEQPLTDVVERLAYYLIEEKETKLWTLEN